MRDALGGDRPLKKALESAYDAALSMYFSDGARGCFVVGTAVTEAVDDAEIRSIVAAGLAQARRRFQGTLAPGARGGRAEQGADIDALAMLASATMHTLAIRARTGSSRSELAKLARKAVGVICR